MMLSLCLFNEERMKKLSISHVLLLQLGLNVGWVHNTFTNGFHFQKNLWIAICYVMDSLELTKLRPFILLS
jgi:hypothetical protein